jgi:hypothetical protein
MSCCRDKLEEKPKRTIMVKEKIIVRVNGREYVVEHDPPQQDFYNDLYGEITATTPTAMLEYINKFEVLDGLLNVGCVANVIPSKCDTNCIYASFTCTWNSDWNPVKMYIKTPSGKAYFFSALPPGLTVSKGSPLSVTWQAVFTASVQSASGWLSGGSLNADSLLEKIANILCNNRGTIVLTARKTKILGRVGTQSGVTFIDVDLTRDPSTRKIMLPSTPSPTSGDVNLVYIDGFTTDNVRISLFYFYLSTPLSVSKDDYLGYELTLV